jgi:glutamate dehydrogenase (NADP+)
LEDQTICISGAGNVALHAALKAIEKNAKVKTLSNSRGFFLNENGIPESDIRWLLTEGQDAENALATLAEESEGEFIKDKGPWGVDCSIAMPCATQNEVNEKTAKDIVNHGAHFLIEGANMPCTREAVEHFKQHKITFVPGKAANAGGVILSGFEMQQNAAMRYQSELTLEEELKKAMESIHEQCVQEGKDPASDIIDYERGANIAAFRKLANAIVATAY